MDGLSAAASGMSKLDLIVPLPLLMFNMKASRSYKLRHNSQVASLNCMTSGSQFARRLKISPISCET